MEIIYKDFVIRYDSLKDKEWPNGCYWGTKYMNNSGDNVIRTRLHHNIDDVKKEIGEKNGI